MAKMEHPKNVLPEWEATTSPPALNDWLRDELREALREIVLKDNFAAFTYENDEAGTGDVCIQVVFAGWSVIAADGLDDYMTQSFSLEDAANRWVVSTGEPERLAEELEKLAAKLRVGELGG